MMSLAAVTIAVIDFVSCLKEGIQKVDRLTLIH